MTPHNTVLGQTDNIAYLHLIRGVAALLVFLGHIRALLFVDYNTNQVNSIGAFFYLATSLGHESVITFFVLSGFLITRSVHTQKTNNVWSAKRYVFDRLARLWIVLVPALILTIIWDYIGTTLRNTSPIYLGRYPAILAVNPITNINVYNLLSNTFFLNSILTPSLGSNGPLWSLAYEFWFYVMFPLFYFSLVRHYNRTSRIINALCLGTVAWFVGQSITLYFMVWLLGSAAFFLLKYPTVKRTITTPVFSLMLLPLAGILMLLKGSFGLHGMLGDILISIMVASLIMSMSKPEAYCPRALKYVAIHLSSISFSLYLLHLPFAIFLCSMSTTSRYHIGWKGLVHYVIICTITLLYVVAFWYIFERNTKNVKLWLFDKPGKARRLMLTIQRTSL